MFGDYTGHSLLLTGYVHVDVGRRSLPILLCRASKLKMKLVFFISANSTSENIFADS